MNVSKLHGAKLDYWVAMAMGADPKKVAIIGGKCVLYDQETAPWPLQINCMPSTDWAQGGPIIERERISITSDDKPGWLAAMPDDRLGDWGAWTRISHGDTALVAAMRSYVTSNFGDEVEEVKT